MSKELVWVSKEILEQVKAMDESQSDIEAVKEILTKFQREVIQYTDIISDTTTELRQQTRKVKDALKDVMDAEIKEMYEFWEELNVKRDEIQKKISQAADVVRKSKADITSLKQEISSLNLYGVDKLIDTIEKISYMSDKEKDLLSHVFSFDKR